MFTVLDISPEAHDNSIVGQLRREVVDKSIKYQMLRDLLIDLGCPWPEDGTELDKLTHWIRSMKKNEAYEKVRSYVLNSKPACNHVKHYEADILQIMNEWGS